MLKHFILSLSLISSLSWACGLHQETGFNFVSEPGSLEVFGNIIDVRRTNALGNQHKPEHFRLFSFKSALAKANSNKVNFSIFEAIKGHYSAVTLGESITVEGRKSLPQPDELLLISELDVLDALATNVISWEDAKAQGLIVVNGNARSVSQLEKWFSEVF